MINLLRRAIVALALIAGFTPAVAQQFPLTMPANTLYGRLGIGTGPGSAIPVATIKGGLGLTAKPLVILASGQSNFVRQRAFTWAPNSNARIWNNVVGTDGSVGTAFVGLNSTTVDLPSKFASDVADVINRPVCLINISVNGIAISHWLTGTPSPDMYGNIVANIVPALAACGATKIDLFLWWQGEADSTPINASYNTNFSTMMSRFWANSWFPQETPVMVHGIASFTDGSGVNANADLMNLVLELVVNADADKRRFVYTTSLHGATYWDATDPGHMTAQGYFSAGALSSSAYLKGPGRNAQPIVNPVNGFYNFGNPAVLSSPFSVNLNTIGAVLPVTSGELQFVCADTLSCFPLFDSFGSFTNFAGRRANGTLAAKTTLIADDLITGLGAQGYDGTAYSSGNVAAVGIFAAETWTAAHHGTYALVNNTTPGTLTAYQNMLLMPTRSVLNFSASASIGNLPTTTALVNIAGADGGAAFTNIEAFGNFTNYAGRRANGTFASKTALTTDDLIVGLGGQGYDGAAYSSGNAAALNLYAQAPWTGSNHSTYGALSLVPNASITGGTYHRWDVGSYTIGGATSGSVKLAVPAVAGANTLTFPAGTTDFSATGGASKFVKQASAGAALTVVQPVAADISGLGNYATLSAGQLANSLGADALLNNTSNYIDGPQTTQGTTGTWFASGSVTLSGSAADSIFCKLWDGTTVMASAEVTVPTVAPMMLALSGFLASPAANIRISCRDVTNTTGKILFNATSNSKDSTLTVFRIN